MLKQYLLLYCNFAWVIAQGTRHEDLIGLRS